jgi:hypothetical protein
MSNPRNWLLTGLLCLGGYILLVIWILAPGPSEWPLLWRLEDWWMSGGFCSLAAIVLGYILIQGAGRGSLTPRLLGKGGFFLLLPFLVLGDCAGDAYQGARSLGWIGAGTGRAVRTIDKDFSNYDGHRDFRLIVRDQKNPILEWELPNGKVVQGFEVPVSEEVYERHRVGSRISIVELPGESYPNYRLEETAKEQVPWNAAFAVMWSALAAFEFRYLRREFRKSGLNEPHNSAAPADQQAPLSGR